MMRNDRKNENGRMKKSEIRHKLCCWPIKINSYIPKYLGT